MVAFIGELPDAEEETMDARVHLNFRYIMIFFSLRISQILHKTYLILKI